MSSDTVRVEREGPVTIVTIDRPEVRNAVDGPTARALHEVFLAFDNDPTASVAVLTGAGGTFCAGADLKALSSGERVNPLEPPDDFLIPAPMGPSRLLLSKPVIAAVEGNAVAGGLELAAWCDLRVAAQDAVFGVYCRRWGVPLIDGGTVRLPRLVGHSRAMDMILTGRGVSGQEAVDFGLVNRLVDPGTARTAAVALAQELAAFPQNCLRLDRHSAYQQWSLDIPDALAQEFDGGMEVLASGESISGASRFASGAGRHGQF